MLVSLIGKDGAAIAGALWNSDSNGLAKFIGIVIVALGTVGLITLVS